MRILGSTKIVRFSRHEQGDILFFRFDFKKFRFFEERASLSATGFEQQNFALRIPRALESYDFSVHGRGDFPLSSKNSFTPTRGSFMAARLEHRNPIPGALKSYDFSVHGQGDILLFRFDFEKISSL